MKFTLEPLKLSKQTADCIIVGIYEERELTPNAKELDKISQKYLQNLLKEGAFQGKIGQTLMLYSVPHIPFSKVLLVGCGEKNPLNLRNYRKVIHASIKALIPTPVKNVISTLTELNVAKNDLSEKIKHAVLVMNDAMYRFDQFKTKKEPAISLQEMQLTVPKHSKSLDTALNQALCISKGVEYTKNLANLPSNICTPSYLAQEAKKLAKQYKNISVKILEESDMKKLGMNALLAVSKGSRQDAKLICLEYKGGKKTKTPIALVGKGITFDTGGISLKPSDSMVGMKYDMCGAATVLGTLKAAAELKLPLHIVGILATAENMPGGHATKPEDIVVSLSGQTIEILNTDAEGRLVLCDAITYAERYKPDTVIDIATLTGAVVVALGFHATGLLSNHEPLSEALQNAGIESHDRVWPLPLWDEYQEQLKSPFADMTNVGGRAGGTITAACFLSRFAKKFHWAHLDVAGTAAMMTGTDRYATGRPVPLLMQYLIHRAEKKHA